MKKIIRRSVGVVMFAMIFSLPSLVHAEMMHGDYKGVKMDKEACADQIQVLKESAAALQTSNPDLAKGLTDLADKKAEQMKEWQEMKDKYSAKKKLLKDSAAALKTANPALAKELQKMSRKHRMDKDESDDEDDD